MAQPDKNVFLHTTTTGNPDPCRHFALTTYATDAYLSTTNWSQGQTRVGFPITWECGDSFADPISELHALVGDYIRLESGAQSGEYKKITVVENNKRVTLASAWSVDQGAVDWSLLRVVNERSSQLHIEDLFEPITKKDLDTLDILLIRLQARIKGSAAGDGSEYSRANILSHLDNSIVEVTL